jgi:hypothetical protein
LQDRAPRTHSCAKSGNYDRCIDDDAA